MSRRFHIPRARATRPRASALGGAAALLAVAALGAWIAARTRARRIAHDRASSEAPDAAAAPIEVEPAAPASIRADRPATVPRRLRTRRGAVSVGFLALAAAVCASIPGTSATLADQVTMSSVSAAAAPINPPTALTPSMSAGNVRVAYTAPAAGISPTNYTFYRSTTSGSGYASLGTTATSPYTDATAAQCTTYYYTGRSNYASLQSGNATQASIRTPDTTKPVIVPGVAYGVNGSNFVPNFIRSGGTVEVYANVTDNCSTGAALAVTFNFPGIGSTPATPGTYQPEGGGGPTYNYKFGPYPVPALTDGYTLDWTLDARDAAGNTVSTDGNTITNDTSGPVIKDSQLVAARTDFLVKAPSYSRISTVAGAAGYFAYANVSDAHSGIEGGTVVAANATNITTGESSLALPFGPVATKDGTAWTNKSAMRMPRSLTDGSTYSYTVTATDPLGNATTGTYYTTIDNTAPTVTGCGATNAVRSNKQVAAGDSTTFTFSELMDPDSLSPGWNGSGSANVGTLTLTAAASGNDWMNDGSANLFSAATGAANAYDLGAANWLKANVTVSFANSTLARSGMDYDLTFGSGATTTHRNNGNGVVHLSTTMYDPAGNANTTTTIGCPAKW